MAAAAIDTGIRDIVEINFIGVRSVRGGGHCYIKGVLRHAVPLVPISNIVGVDLEEVVTGIAMGVFVTFQFEGIVTSAAKKNIIFGALGKSIVNIATNQEILSGSAFEFVVTF